MSATPIPPLPLHTPVLWPDAGRKAAFDAWFAPFASARGLHAESLAPASADASFRRYLRVRSADASFIVMDAPPPEEDVRPFVHIAALIEAAGLHVPSVLECDAEQGFLLLSDLGSRLYLDAMRESTGDRPGAQAEKLMRDAVKALVKFQTSVDAASLPAYDTPLLQRELDLFPEWCVQREFGIVWTDAERATWERICGRLIDSAVAQPTVAVHRDFMPRNLMVCEPNPGILDFQDAVRGPITYDPASLLRDAFFSWDEADELDLAVRYWEQARAAGLPVHEDFGEFWRQLEWMGLQRHLKVLGIFCRLKHRDGKPKYADDLPRFFAYATKVSLRYIQLKPLLRLLEPLSGLLVKDGYTF